MAIEQVDVEARAQRIEAAVARILQRASAVTDPTRLYVAPAEGEWTAMELLGHVAEVLPYWANQVLDVSQRSQDNQPYGRTHLDPDRVEAVRAHAHDRFEDALPRLREAGQQAVAALRALPADGWGRTGRHERRGEMSVREAVDAFLVDHVEEHARQVEATLDAATAG